jgi:hypothetical protein
VLFLVLFLPPFTPFVFFVPPFFAAGFFFVPDLVFFVGFFAGFVPFDFPFFDFAVFVDLAFFPFEPFVAFFGAAPGSEPPDEDEEAVELPGSPGGAAFFFELAAACVDLARQGVTTFRTASRCPATAGRGAEWPSGVAALADEPRSEATVARTKAGKSIFEFMVSSTFSGFRTI